MLESIELYGVLQYRRWNETRGVSDDADWIAMNPDYQCIYGICIYWMKVDCIGMVTSFHKIGR